MQVYTSLQNGTSGRLRQDKDYKLARVGEINTTFVNGQATEKWQRDIVMVPFSAEIAKGTKWLGSGIGTVAEWFGFTINLNVELNLEVQGSWQAVPFNSYPTFHQGR